MRRVVRPFTAAAVLGVLAAGLFTQPALATAPTAAQTGPRDRRVLWLGHDAAVMVFRADGSWECIASDPATLAFGLGYAAARSSPDGVDLVRRRAEGGLEPEDDPAVQASNALARLSRPNPADVESSLAEWPPVSRRILDALAAGLNLGLEEEGRSSVWSDVRLAALALQQDVFRSLGGLPVPPGEKDFTLRLRLGGGAAQPWGYHLAGWVQDLFPWLQVDQAEMPAPAEGPFTWADPSESDGVLVWTDAAGRLGLVYKDRPRGERMRDLEHILAGVQPES
ncbi:MAG: hypothetical protein ACM3ZA_09810 [Bacillota bacterium]